ncbi:MAG: Ig-like domain repeat protein [Spirochaetales bacterium]|nr:Ig-like domain repeat protein [Spirochaetales bacterium]
MKDHWYSSWENASAPKHNYDDVSINYDLTPPANIDISDYVYSSNSLHLSDAFSITNASSKNYYKLYYNPGIYSEYVQLTVDSAYESGDYQSGFKGVLHNSESGVSEIFAADGDSVDLSLGISDDLHILASIDNVHNASDYWYLKLVEDGGDPVVAINLEDDSYEYADASDPTGKFNVSLDLLNESYDGSESGIYVTDGLSGLSGNYSFVFSIWDDSENAYVEVSSADQGSAEQEGDSGEISLNNLIRDVYYKLEVQAEDNVGNWGNGSVIIYLPEVPVLDGENFSGTWINDYKDLTVTAPIAFGDDVDGIESVEILGLYEGEEMALHTLSGSDIASKMEESGDDGYYDFTFTLEGEEYSAWFQSVAHGEYTVILRTSITTGDTEITETYSVPSFPNRLPFNSSQESIELFLLNGSEAEISLENSSDLYGDEFVVSGSVADFYSSFGGTWEDLYFIEEFDQEEGALDSFEDYDGDTITVELYEPDSEVDILYLNEMSGGVSLAQYLLPYRCYLDSIAPQYTDITLLITEDGSSTFNTISSGSGLIGNALPTGISITGVTDESGIAEILYTLTDGEGTVLSETQTISEDNYDGEEFGYDWPFGEVCPEGEEKTFTLTVELYDRAGNSSSWERTIYLDRAAPEISLTEGEFIQVDGEDVALSYGDEGSTLTVGLTEDFFEADNFSVYSLTVDSESFAANSYVDETTLELSHGGDSFSFGLENYEPNEPISLDLTFTDQAGNSLVRTLLAATPAAMETGDVTLSGTEEQSYDDYDDSKGFYLSFLRNGDDLDWTVLVLEREGSAEWEELSASLSLEREYFDTGLEGHGSYNYRFTPVNDSGYAHDEGALTWENVTVGNYLPQMTWSEDSLLYREEQAYFGSSSPLGFTVYDREGDTLTTEILVDAGELESVLSAQDGATSLTYVNSTGSEDFYSIPDGSYAYEDGELYNLVFRTSDSWSGGSGEGSLASEKSFRYDNQPPALTTEEDFVNLTETLWGYSGVNLTAADEGVGLDRLWGVLSSDDQDDIILEDLSLTPTADGVYDDLEQSLTFPEGAYDLVIYMEDRLGNLSFTETHIVLYDGTAPTWEGLSLADTEEISLIDGVYTYGTPLVEARIEWDDNLSGLASLEYEYSYDGEVVSSGSKDLNDSETRSQTMVCAPNYTLLEEGVAYDFSVTLIDQGGNVSVQKSLEQSLRFDMESPDLSLESWALESYGGSYVTSSATVDLPEISLSDTLSEEEEIALYYELFDSEGVSRGSFNDSLTFPEQGEFELELTAVDLGGLESSLSLPVIYDSESPDELTLTGSTGAYDSWGRAVLSLSAQDDLTGVAAYYFELREGETVLSSESYTPSQAELFSLTLPESSTGSLSFYGAAEDGAGNLSSYVLLDTVSVTAADDPVSIEAPLYYGMGQNLTASWEYLGDGEISHYTVLLYGLGSDGTSTVLSRDVTASYISLAYDDIMADEEWIELILSIQPVTSEGLSLTAVLSHTITVDLDSPVIEEFTFPDIIYPDELTLGWTITDSSPLEPLIFYLEEVDGSDEDMTFTYAGALILSDSEESEERDLSEILADLDYDTTEAVRIRLIAEDRAGNISEEVSGLITIDSSSAPLYEIVDQGDYLNPDENDLYFQWEWAQVDAESGEEGYYYQLSQDGVLDGDNWSYTTEREVTYSSESEVNLEGDILDDYEDGTELFLLVKRETSAGQEEVLYSDGIILDRTAPVITSVKLTTTEGEEISEVYYTGASEIYLLVDGEDQVSGIESFNVQSGLREGSDFSSVDSFDWPGEDEVIETSLPIDGVESDDVIYYQVIAYNGVEQESLPSYSSGIIYSPSVPVVEDVLFTLEEGTAYVSWSAASSLPLEGQTVSIHSYDDRETVLYSLEAETGDRSATLSGVDLEDGYYLAKVTLLDEGGNEVSDLSPRLTVDSSAPTLVSLDYSDYIYDTLNLELTSDELLTNVMVELSSGDVDLVDSDEAFDTSLTSWSEEISLSDLDSWSETESWSSRVLTLNIRLRDSGGNWSDWYSYDVIFDSTAPSAPEVSRDNTLYWGATEVTLDQALVGEADEVGGISFTSEEDTSPLYAYRWGVVSDTSEEPSAWSSLRYLDEEVLSLTVTDTDLDELVLINGQSFYLAIQTLNRADQYSEAGYSELLTADLEAPTFSLEASEPLDSYLSGEDTVYVYQGEGELTLTVSSDELSPYLVNTFVITDPDNTIVTETIEGIDLNDGLVHTISFTFDTDSSGVHTATVDLEDLQGRSSTETLLFRCNPLPTIDIPDDLTARPGESLSLSCMDWVDSLNEIVSVSLSGDGLEEDLTADGESDLTLPALFHSEEGAQETVYTYNITYTDELDVSASEEFEVTLKNTTEGSLLTDEIWSGTHYLTGEVIIPEGIGLTILADTEVLALAGEVYGYDQALVLDTGGTLTVEESVTFASAYGGNRWLGLSLADSVSLSGVTISDAERGVTVCAGDFSFELADSVISGNETGVHILNGNSTVSGCVIEENEYYGVKEDGGASPIMTDNSFASNGFDYYDEDGTVVEADEINNLSSDNSGNGGE